MNSLNWYASWSGLKRYVSRTNNSRVRVPVCYFFLFVQEWVPYSTTNSLYIRPTIIGTDPTLGVAHSR
jgi:hypothetical protein